MESKRPFLSLDVNKVKEDPLAWDMLKKWFTEHVGPDEILLETALIYSPRFLYDFFDDSGVKVIIDSPMLGDKFGFTIEGPFNAAYMTVHNAEYDTRIQAEQEAFYRAFLHLIAPKDEIQSTPQE